MWVVGVLALVLVGVLVGIMGTGDSSRPGAARSGSGETILVYTALEDDEYPVYLELFRKQHPDIRVNIVRDSTGIVTAKLLAEKNNSQADVVWGLAATSLILAEKQGMLEPYAPKGLATIHPKFRDPADTPSWVGIKAWETGFTVNTIELGKKNLPMPKSYEDLLNPVYRGQIVMPNPASSGTGYLTVSAILQLMGEREGWAYLDRLHQNIMQYTHSGSKPARMAGQGEAIIGISFGYRSLKEKTSGSPVESIWPVEGSGWDLEANGLVKKPNIKPGAKAFLDFAISQEIMNLYAGTHPITAAPSGVPVPEGYPADPMAMLTENDLVKSAEDRDRVLREWSRRYDGKSENR